MKGCELSRLLSLACGSDGARYFFKLTKNHQKKFGDPNGIRTRVTAVKGRCPNRWTIGSVERGGEFGRGSDNLQP